MSTALVDLRDLLDVASVGGGAISGCSSGSTSTALPLPLPLVRFTLGSAVAMAVTFPKASALSWSCLRV